jgi:hypothetical protein
MRVSTDVRRPETKGCQGRGKYVHVAAYLNLGLRLDDRVAYGIE